MLAHQLEMTLTEEELTAEPYCQAIISGNVTVQQKTVLLYFFILFLVVANKNRKMHDFSRVASCSVFACLFGGWTFCVCVFGIDLILAISCVFSCVVCIIRIVDI